MFKKIIAYIILVSSIILLGINIYGILWGEYKQPEVSEWGMGAKDRTITHLKSEDLAKKNNENDLEYFTRINKNVNDYIIHGSAPITAIWDNYFMWLYDVFNPDNAYFFENISLERGLNKGVGLCSQHSKIIATALEHSGYQSRIVRLDGHVVASAQDHQGKWYIVDADYGLTIPYELDYIEKNKEILDEYYTPIYSHIPEDVRLPMKDIYGTSENNRIMEIIEDKGWKAYYFEKITDYLKWLLPILLLLFSLFSLYKMKFKKSDVKL